MDKPLKQVYRLLPKEWVQPMRNLLEVGGGTMDTVLFKATDEEWEFDKRKRGRHAPASPSKQPKIPKADWKRIHDIKYYSRDPRLMSRDTISMEDTFRLPPMDAKPLLAAAERGELPEDSVEIVTPAKEADGSSPVKFNKDVAVYSPDGLRSANTASWVATRKALDGEEPDHLPAFEWLRPGSNFDANDVVEDWAKKGMIFGPLGRRRPHHRSKWAHTTRETGH